MFNEKTILITGGTGSFGKKCYGNILRNIRPKRLIIFSRDEFKQFEMAKGFIRCRNFDVFVISSETFGIKSDCISAFRDVDYVIHAAALKQVPAAEYNPFEAVKTNILGAQNVINVAIDQGVKKVIALSTDKAANPVNLYGATKLCSDKLFIAGNSYVGEAGQIQCRQIRECCGQPGQCYPFFSEMSGKGKSAHYGSADDPFLDHFGTRGQFCVGLPGNNGGG